MLTFLIELPVRTSKVVVATVKDGVCAYPLFNACSSLAAWNKPIDKSPMKFIVSV